MSLPGTLFRPPRNIDYWAAALCLGRLRIASVLQPLPGVHWHIGTHTSQGISRSACGIRNEGPSLSHHCSLTRRIVLHTPLFNYLPIYIPDPQSRTGGPDSTTLSHTRASFTPVDTL
ncbi:hypothetical protein E2C01_038761 [Portunus trituberculatus]|uniref:Uncharacterized protein n=1 Tax=Portunus trituberculatus TaxID=210409 RepID=A0A5B7FI02_PORTR|nr:hypothetical protein [Portunus trituberculatus]